MTQLFRSLIFVPGNNPRFLEKAKKLQADIVCFDLEDSVPDNEKTNARKLIKSALKSKKSYKSSIFVRTNSPLSGKIPSDLKEIVQKGIDGIVIPKVNNAKELKKIEKTIAGLEKKRKLKPTQLIPSIESAEGVVNTYQIASSSKRVVAVVFGVFDLLNDIGVEYTKDAEGAKYSRRKIPVDAQAAGVAAIDAIWQDLKDSKGLENDCKIGKSLGYSGKSIIHPDHISVTHKLFHPNKSEIEWAKKVCKTYLESTKKGKGATTVDGKMIDEVHFKQAKALLELVK
ncbi:malyl-CoA thioesterase protein [Marine Group I thaumarchaeote SCGC AAA799-E16]|uniref:Malyl-CoA thioesterase protein n=3 Tax=Marine Group I TaxID=905826 RepID=A0A087RMZ3_9ARCH|nr:malyl-CoA thioesterase protein [Marine Group I thaumarchaeote SCGC AAA799-E16]KFM14847.1 malyl-CoA thioesterase protein [Marine Group I thaumarchaeote SCGC AAA799-D11]KFM17603.1 Citrate lyase subunit beta protein [Marine Group I thaumarchaeote SCGC RSA3]